MAKPRTMFDKIWDRHTVRGGDHGFALLYVSRHMVYESSFHAFALLGRSGRKVRRPGQTFSTADHFVPTASPAAFRDAETRRLVEKSRRNARDAGIAHFGPDDPRQGIVHVIGPELGIVQPGLLLACADSHVSTLGAFGALALGIGHTESYHVLATQTLWQRRPRLMRMAIEGERPFGVTAKDIILAVIAKLGVSGAVGHAIEFAGSAVRELSMEERMTVCNMAIESGARTALAAPDHKTYAYLDGRPLAPKGEAKRKSMAWWRTLPSDAGATFDAEVTLGAGDVAPMVTWGTAPEDALPITARIPDPAREADPDRRSAMHRAPRLHGAQAGHPTHRRRHRPGVHRLLHQRAPRGPARRRGGREKGARRGAGDRRARLGPGKAAGRGGGAGPGVQSSRIRVAERGVLHVRRHQRRCGRPRRALRLHLEPELRGPGQGPGARTHLMSPAMAAAAALTRPFDRRPPYRPGRLRWNDSID